MRFILILMISAYSFLGWTQKEKDWRLGTVVLTDNKVLSGLLYFTGFETVLFRTDSTKLVDVFRSHNIKQIRFYDSINNINRKFITLKQSVVYHQSDKLYEVVLEGSIKVIRSLPLEVESMMLVTNPLSYNYYLKVDDEIVALSKFRDRYYKDLLKSCYGLCAFIDYQKLNPNYQADAIRIIKFCNVNKVSFEFMTSN